MKKLVTMAIFCIAAIAYSQEVKPTFKADGNLVKATYYYEDGKVSTEGYFKDKKLTGKWIRYNKQGEKTQMAFYNEGKKVGKWFVWKKDQLQEITYKDNTVASVNVWKPSVRVAVND
ncbi:toxin-antitoxin system YwqK family antitoxin [Polaribacter tangerinus]|uniref:toxin-antitoxin system YwqK family antitoxin n=1 Tax=Polaribacter tangerinus TaxID=1920034 RepID=UPI000B4B7B7F|nr:nicotinic acid mononucleotide adenyltransferase [Polaribacter tangerinus]